MAGQLFRGMPITLLASAARTTSSNSGNLKNSTAAMPSCDNMSIYLDATSITGSGNTLSVTIDTSIDGGTTWFPAFAFTTITASSKTARIDARPTGLGETEAGAEATAVAAGTALKANTVLTRDFRVAWVLGGTSSPSAPFGVYAIVQPKGSRS